ncbi:hypothetical protein ERO13_A05G388700v2 [Gossypium hirsutum]|uniref:RING-type E3 ubiquitin transferase n=5 Tax=Gossypium TaxID=3633 RepID=A0ABR0Q6P1_GOSAR|nr:RING-H2 finger protein ATL78-like [Gossypium hirsutum]XP_017614885.1 RING-H2 finger protein ATL78-like [Gossypium arboreum]KAB2085567.1 hypothetical protein ES319_A05G406800v1 [Gossypium barbadense]TYH20494.1 hypothetical protein ES288_A05G434200v1 [Gossypium darwinii]TYI31188.1 hypothetical protein ES332_A05G436500v1 [Gossypium tomentosum]KAG4203230.1 hypothetical protein ERO13_A05G388700v2 [Gossypium hirsutum]KAK5834945.1 hypothetical protein PVK06_010625 [Gossypium arboreum]
MSIAFTTQFIQDFVGEFHSRRLLLPNPENHHNSSHPYTTADITFNGNLVVMVLWFLLCALICSLGLKSIIKCTSRCLCLLTSESGGSSTTASANTGVKPKALNTFPTVNYSDELKLSGLDSECVICLSDFAPGDRLRLLPKCNHGFHVRCIDKWLSSHSSCPKCRYCLIETCQEIVGSREASSSEPPSSLQQTILTIPPIAPESFIHSYRSISLA